jgi:hypothetical protein
VEIGRDSVDVKVDGIKASAAKKGLPPVEVLRAKLGKKIIPGLIGPNGQVYILDGHHKISAAGRIIAKAPNGDTVKAQIRVLADYTGKSEQEFAKDLFGKYNAGQFPEEMLRKNPSAVQKLGMLPADFPSMQNNPYRSLAGNVFDKMGLNGADMEDFIQFKVAKALKERLNIGLKPGLANDEEVIKKARTFLTTDAKVVEILRNGARGPEVQFTNELIIEKAIQKTIRKTEKSSDIASAARSNSNPRMARIIQAVSQACGQ